MSRNVAGILCVVSVDKEYGDLDCFVQKFVEYDDARIGGLVGDGWW